jgi:hypothetical protein
MKNRHLKLVETETLESEGRGEIRPEKTSLGGTVTHCWRFVRRFIAGEVSFVQVLRRCRSKQPSVGRDLVVLQGNAKEGQRRKQAAAK